MMLKQLVIAGLIGIISILYIAQKDPWIEQLMFDYFTSEFQRSLDCRMSARLETFSFSGYMKLTAMQVVPVIGTDWSWHADVFEIQFSWLQLLLYGSFDFTIVMQQPELHSLVLHNELAIQEHLNLAFRGPQFGVYTFLKVLTCKNMSCTFIDTVKNMRGYISFDAEIQKCDNVSKCNVDLFEGYLRIQDRVLCNNISGSLHIDVFDGQPTVDLCLNGAASFELPQLGSTMMPCYISGSWHHNGGTLSIKNIDNSFAIDPISIQPKGLQTNISIDAKLPLGYVWRMFTDNLTDDRLSGNVMIQTKLNLTDNGYTIHGHLTLQRMFWQSMELGSLGRITFHNQDDQIEGSLYMQRTSGACISGNWLWQQKDNSGYATIKNNARLILSPKHDWQILPEDLGININFDQDHVNVVYDAKATHSKVHNQIVSNGNIAVTDKSICATGLFDDNKYACVMHYQPTWDVETFLYTLSDGSYLIDVSKKDDTHYGGNISFRCIKDLLKKRYDYDVQGEGSLELAIDWGPSVLINMHLKDATIRLPRTYNFLNGFDCQCVIDRQLKKCTVNDLMCNLHNGRVYAKKMFFELSDDFTPRFVYAPLLIEHCLINMGKELFAVVSGDLLVSKRSDNGLLCNGQLLIERSQLKANLFSDVFQRKLRTYTAYSFETEDDELQCDISIKTKHPVRVQTPFLDTDARIDLHVGNKVRDPLVIGTISLNAGKLHFPYKPLYIKTGVLHFIPGQLDDPIIELYAKNSIKKNNIGLQVTGSLQNQHIRLESSPTLTEEQIISLLLVGSQEESLNMVMPALIMQNIKSMLFSYDQSTANMNRYFNALFKSFGGRIHFVPSFIDRSGRGGLRGAIEIDLGDRVRAVIQKNFSLTEDTRVELEYLFSDDISVRATRDIRRDLIAEVEMRYKFGNS